MNPGLGQEFPTPEDGVPALPAVSSEMPGAGKRTGTARNTPSRRPMPVNWPALWPVRWALPAPVRRVTREKGDSTDALPEMALYATPFSLRKGPYLLSVPWMCLMSQFLRKFITSMLSVAVAPE